jgi:beta-glucanase (GH16 family)
VREAAAWRAACGGGALAALLNSGFAAPVQAATRACNPIWSDEFTSGSLDPAHWTASEDCWGGGNGERQCYTPTSVSVGPRGLVLTASPRDVVGPEFPARLGRGAGRQRLRHYASGQVTTYGKAAFRYGRIEVRARLPQGQGLWPAIWMLPVDDAYGAFPRSGEIDIAEAVNLGTGGANLVHGSLHAGRALGKMHSLTGATALADPDAFHVFGLDWTPRRLTWLLDGKPYLSAPTRPPFDRRFYLILNLAVGGRWPEANGHGVDPGSLPARMEISWVRVCAPAS